MFCLLECKEYAQNVFSFVKSPSLIPGEQPSVKRIDKCKVKTSVALVFGGDVAAVNSSLIKFKCFIQVDLFFVGLGIPAHCAAWVWIRRICRVALRWLASFSSIYPNSSSLPLRPWLRSGEVCEAENQQQRRQ